MMNWRSGQGGAKFGDARLGSPTLRLRLINLAGPSLVNLAAACCNHGFGHGPMTCKDGNEVADDE